MQELMAQYRPWKEGEKIEALFMFQAGTVWASLESVYRSCLTDKRFSVRLVLMTEVTVEKSHMAGAREFLEGKKIPYELYEEADLQSYRPHVVFIQFPYDAAFHTPETLSLQFRRRGTRVVYVPYGIEISDTEISRKNHFHNFVVENAWRVYTCCEGIREEYLKYCHNRSAVRAYGSPKFDAVSRRESVPLDRQIIERSRGRKILVWKIHYPQKISENGFIVQITPYLREYIAFAEHLDAFCDLFFVVLAHPKLLRGVVASDLQGDDSLMEQAAELLRVLEGRENVFVDFSKDYRNSFYHADAIIMDRSAVMIEAAMLDIPVLLMKNRDYYEPMTAPVENIVSCFIQGSACGDMVAFAESVQRNEDVNAPIRQKAVAENMPFCDGLCGERIKNDIAEGLMEPQHRLRVVLYGSGEICRYYMEKQQWNRSEHFELLAVADSSEAKWGQDFFGVRIVSPQRLREMDFDAVVIMTEPHYFEIKKSLVYEHYLDERKIWRLDYFVAALMDGFGREYPGEPSV